MINVNLQITKLNNYQTSSFPLNYPDLSPAHLPLAKCSSPIWFSTFSPYRFFRHHEGSSVVFRPFWAPASNFDEKRSACPKKCRFLPPSSQNSQKWPRRAEMLKNCPARSRCIQSHPTTVEVGLMPSFELPTHQVSERVSMRWTLTFLVQLQNLLKTCATCLSTTFSSSQPWNQFWVPWASRSKLVNQSSRWLNLQLMVGTLANFEIWDTPASNVTNLLVSWILRFFDWGCWQKYQKCSPCLEV